MPQDSGSECLQSACASLEEGGKPLTEYTGPLSHNLSLLIVFQSISLYFLCFQFHPNCPVSDDLCPPVGLDLTSALPVSVYVCELNFLSARSIAAPALKTGASVS